jgi:hypothetical protein
MRIFPITTPPSQKSARVSSRMKQVNGGCQYQQRKILHQGTGRRVPSVARVRNHSARTQHITRAFIMTLNAFLHFKFLCCRSVPITTNIDILAQAAQFVGASRSINAPRTLFLSYVRCGARLQVSRDTLCMHSICHVISSGGGAQELRELHIVGLRPDLLMCTRMPDLLMCTSCTRAACRSASCRAARLVRSRRFCFAEAVPLAAASEAIT